MGGKKVSEGEGLCHGSRFLEISLRMGTNKNAHVNKMFANKI